MAVTASLRLIATSGVSWCKQKVWLTPHHALEHYAKDGVRILRIE